MRAPLLAIARPGIDDQDRLRLLGMVLGEGRIAQHRRGDAEARKIHALPRPFLDLPGQDGLLAVDEDLGIGEAWAGENIRIPGFDVLAADLRRARHRRGQGQHGDP